MNTRQPPQKSTGGYAYNSGSFPYVQHLFVDRITALGAADPGILQCSLFDADQKDDAEEALHLEAFVLEACVLWAQASFR